MLQPKKISKKQRRVLRQNGVEIKTGMGLSKITPLTQNQKKAFDAYFDDKNLMLHGTAGTGKTFTAFYLGLKDVMNDNYDKVIVVRSVVPSREMGYLPGNQKEKVKVYEIPYYSICSELYGRGDAYEILKQKEQIEFISTSFIRGITISNSVVIIDECQNMNWGELNTILTRIGENCRVIICGDTKQSDLNERDGKNDLLKLISVCKKLGTFEFVQMTRDDIVRSGFVKSWIIECENQGL